MKEDMHLRIDAEIMRGVRVYAAERGVSVAAAVSILLTHALKEAS